MGDNEKVCDACGEVNARTALRCAACHDPFTTAVSNLTPQGEPMAKLCPYCQEEINSAARKCKHCGEYLDESLQKRALPAPKLRITYQMLAFFLGGLGIHNFYAGHNTLGLVQLLLTLFTGGLGAFIVIPWALLEIFATTKDGSGQKMK